MSKKKKTYILLIMPHQKKRPVHYCKIHRKTPAAGRCAVCKAWVCKQCSSKILHQLYCDTCHPKHPSQQTADIAAPKPDSPAPAASQTKPSITFRSLVLLAGITLALCSIVFGVWNMRFAADLSMQNRILKEKRSDLLNQIKDRNQEISALQSTLDSLKNLIDIVVPKKKNSFVFRSDLAMPPLINGLPVSFDNGTPQKRLVCLTFDGSSFANAAKDILDTLGSRGVKATMFISGEFMRKFPDIVVRIVREGHEPGNHTFSHPHLTSYAQDQTQSLLPAITEAYLARELGKTDSLFRALTGVLLAPLWRAPYGEYNRIICIWAQHAGFLHIGWRQGKTWKQGLDSNDWIPDEESRGYHTPQEVYDKIIALASGPENGISGGIILMHLGTVRTQKDRQVHLMLGKLIDTLRSLNYRFVPVSEMMKESGVDIGLLKHS
jgi:peptidoglycan/xylan/chitin deacetylase (PgdA/CDA1 family)